MNQAMKAMGRRIRDARTALGLSQDELARRLRPPVRRAAVAQWESGATTPRPSRWAELARLLKVNLKWLAEGRGPRRPGKAAQTADAARPIPVVSYVQAGRWGEVVDAYAEGGGESYISADFRAAGPRAFGLVIEGNSMAPEFRPGDIVIIDPDVAPVPGDCVVAKLDDAEEATFKKYRPRGRDRRGREVIDLVPLNPDYPTLTIDAEHKGRIIGTLVEHRRYRRP